MTKSIVLQSHRSPLPCSWIAHCLASVRDWCVLNHYDYHFMGDALFDWVPADLLRKTQVQRVVATDLARLLVLQNALNDGYDMAIWLDADFLVFNPAQFVIPDETFALGREVWVQYDKQGKLKVYKKVHNAFLMFRKANCFLDFYADTAQRLLAQNQGTMPPQFIGPKLLTALHNTAVLPVMEVAGMLSPLVIKDVIKGGGGALDLFVAHSQKPIAGANLCISSCENNAVSNNEMKQLITLLLDNAALVPADMADRVAHETDKYAVTTALQTLSKLE